MQNETHNNLYMQVQEICKCTIREILQLYKINFDFYYARTEKDVFLLWGLICMCKIWEILQLYKINFDFIGQEQVKMTFCIWGLNLIACARSRNFATW